MHHTALLHARLFFETYLAKLEPGRILEIGSQDVNGSLREVAPAGWEYVGADFVEGRGVDVLLDDPYKLPFPDNSFDAIVCSSCYEHSEFFWLSFLEAIRVLRPDGVFYLNTPSNGAFHRYPADCWRFYPDSGVALQNWARRNGYPVTMLESFTGKMGLGIWCDAVQVFIGDGAFSERFPHRIQDGFSRFNNGMTDRNSEIARYSDLPEDQRTFWRKLLLRLYLIREKRRIRARK